MRNIAIFAGIFTLLCLGGCATAPQMSDAEKDQIKSGKLVKFTTIDHSVSGVVPSNTRLYVCAVSTYQPTASTPCYPKLSAYLGEAFSKAGIQVSSTKEKADEIVYATLSYFYVGGERAASGDAYRAMFDETIENGLEKSSTPTLSEATMESIFKTNVAVKKNIATQSAIDTVVRAGIVVVGAAMGNLNGAMGASQAITGLANPGSIIAPYGSNGPKQMSIVFTMNGTNDRAKVLFVGVYDGPRDIFQAFDKLFHSAVTQSAELFAQNTSPTKTANTQ